jgi:hypothetical protein
VQTSEAASSYFKVYVVWSPLCPRRWILSRRRRLARRPIRHPEGTPGTMTWPLKAGMVKVAQLNCLYDQARVASFRNDRHLCSEL